MLVLCIYIYISDICIYILICMSLKNRKRIHNYKHIRNKMCLRYRVRFVYVSDSVFFLNVQSVQSIFCGLRKIWSYFSSDKNGINWQT